MSLGEAKCLSHYSQEMLLWAQNKKRSKEDAEKWRKNIGRGGRQGRSPGFKANVASRTETERDTGHSKQETNKKETPKKQNKQTKKPKKLRKKTTIIREDELLFRVVERK